MSTQKFLDKETKHEQKKHKTEKNGQKNHKNVLVEDGTKIVQNFRKKQSMKASRRKLDQKILK